MTHKMPNFFIIGAPKCGTTSLASWLAEHPNVYMSPVKEPNFYNADLGKVKITRREYEALFSSATDNHHAIGEASTSYLFSRAAVPNIERELPNSRYIVMVRNPMDMAYSFHEQLLFLGFEHVKSFAEAWRLSEERADGRAVTRWCHEPELLDYKSVCRLGEQIERLFATVTRDRVLVIVLDDVKENPRREYVRVLDFLGVDDDCRTDFPIENPAKERRWPGLQRVAQMAGRASVSAKQRLGVPRTKGTGVLTKLSALNTHYRPRPPLPPGLRRELQDYFRDDVLLLSRLLDRDLSEWVAASR